MFLPQIAPPVERRPIPSIPAETTGVTAQASCVCRNVNGVKTLWCIIGKDLINTNVSCV